MDHASWMPLEVALGVGTLISTGVLGWIVLLRNARSWTNRLFAVLASLICIYTVLNFLSLHPSLTGGHQLFWIRAVMFATSFICPTLLLFVHTFPGAQIDMPWSMRVPLIALMTASGALSLTPLVFVSLSYANSEAIPVPGPGMPVWVLNSGGLLIITFVVLGLRYRRRRDAERARYRLLLIGIVATFTCMFTSTNVAIIAFNTSRFVFLGPPSFVMLVVCVTYAIVQYQLFGIRLAAIYALLAMLFILAVANVSANQSYSGMAMDSVVFIGCVVTGTLLIRAFHAETRHRSRLEQSAQELRHANERLSASNAELERFTHVASHDLREPLRAVIAYGELFERRYVRLLDEAGIEFLGFLVGGARRMERLVESLLTLARVETRGGTFVNTDVGEVVHHVRNALSVQIAETQGEIRVDRLPMIRADPTQIAQVFQNLIANALKFCGPGPPLVIVSSERLSDAWLFRVRDNGIGIDPRFHDQVFETLRRLHTHEEYEGTGIGLAVCKKIVQRHGGRIWVESEIGRGSTFLFTIPDRIPGEQCAVEPSAQADLNGVTNQGCFTNV